MPTGSCPYSAGRHGADVAHHAQRDEDACRADGGLLLRAEAVHADRRALRHAREQVHTTSPSRAARFLEAVAKADTIVFDKTGTLTHASPDGRRRSYPSADTSEDEMLRLAACLEEHYPHSMANAVVEEARPPRAEPRGMPLRGASTSSRTASPAPSTAKRSSSAAHHFVFEDEGCTVPEDEQEKFDALPAQYSHLYLAIARRARRRHLHRRPAARARRADAIACPACAAASRKRRHDDRRQRASTAACRRGGGRRGRILRRGPARGQGRVHPRRARPRGTRSS